MKKKLLTVAVGAALAAVPALYAQADVKVYGMVQFELAQEKADSQLSLNASDNDIVKSNGWNRGTPADPNDNSVLTLEDNQRGRFGFKADEDLGGGLKGFAQIEYDIGGSTEASFGQGSSIREANVGLSGAFGSVMIGTMKSPYKYTGGINYDPFVTTNLEARRNGGMTGGVFGQNGFADNVIGYKTPAGLPVEVWVIYSPDKQGDSTGSPVGAGVSNAGPNGSWDDGDYAASVKFGQKTWEVFFKTAKNKDNSTNLDYTANSVGGKYSIGPHTIVGQYEDTSLDVAGGSDDGKLLFLGYHFKLGNTTLVAQVGDGKMDYQNAALTDMEWTYYTLGAVHHFSKTTRLFGGYTTTDVDNENGTSGANGKRKALSIGLRKDF